MPEEFAAVARALTYATNNKALNSLIRNELKTAFAGTPTAVAVASILVHEADFGTVIPGQPSRSAMARHAVTWSTQADKGSVVTIGNLLREAFTELHDLPGASLLESAFEECDGLKLLRTHDGDLWPASTTTPQRFPRLRAVVADNDGTTVLQLCLGAIDPSYWAARSLLARAVWSARSREPVGHKFQIPTCTQVTRRVQLTS